MRGMRCIQHVVRDGDLGLNMFELIQGVSFRFQTAELTFQFQYISLDAK